MLGAVELVQGGSIRTLFRATGIRNRFWESRESPCHSSTCPMEQVLSAPSAHNSATGQRLLTAQQRGHLSSPAARRISGASG